MDIVKAIQEHLSPNLLHRKYVKQHHPLSGHCYVASEALYYSLPDRHHYKPMVASYNSVSGKASHWWIQNRYTGEIIDPTAEQFTEEFRTHLYSIGRGTGFLTKHPSKRTKMLLDKISK